MIGIINYGMGNLRSVEKAIDRIGGQAKILDHADQLPECDKVILPGVGAFGDAIDHLRTMGGGWIDPIKQHVSQGKPTLGICLGMQLFYEGSEENASPDQPIPGLGLVPGIVRRLTVDQPPYRLKVPHMGWNEITWQRDDPLLANLEQSSHVYFVHGYAVHVDPDNTSTSAICQYGQPFAASLWHNNLWATQFHPEKSQHVGLTILRNFVSL